MTMKLAAQLYTLREYTQTAADLRQTLKRVRAIGYRSVQISAIGPIPADEVRTALEAAGLTVCITHTAYGRLLNDLDGVIADHHLWGCQRVGLGHMPAQFISSDEDNFLAFANILNQVGEKLHSAGLSFHYHNHSFEFIRFGQRNGLELLFAETDPRYVKAILDTYWVQHGGADSIDWVRRLAGRMDVIHLKDMVIQGREQMMAEVGEGNMNWPGILAACAETGVAYAAVEQDICQRNPFESITMSYDYLSQQGLS